MRFPKYIPLIFLSLFAGVFFFFGISVNKNLPKTPATVSPTLTPLPLKQQAWVKEVVDGDTIILKNDEKIRYLGIDAPDQGKPYFQKAKEFNFKLVKDKEVELEFEPRERKDIFDRTLAYVFIKDNFGKKKMVNLLIVEEGLADIKLYSNLKYKQEFINARNWAKELHHGIWFEEFEKLP